MTRPVLARTSSAASGLRFCGMIEEPVVNLSDSLTRPVSGEVQITISSAKRDRCTAAIEAAASVSIAKSRSDTASSEFAEGRSKPSALAVMSRSRSNDVPASAPEPSGDFVEPLARIGKAAAVARRHLDIGQQMMAEGHRLRGLQMGKAGHHRAGMLERLVGERALVGRERGIDRVDCVAHPEAEIGRHLIIARARGMQPSGRRADHVGQPALDIHMNVFERALELNLPASISVRIASRP